MQLFVQKLYIFACRFVQIFSMVLLGGLFFGAFLSTCYSLDMESQTVLTRWDNPFLSLLGIALFLAVLAGLLFLFRKVSLRVFTGVVLGWCIFIGAALIIFGKTVPAADAMSVYSIAEALARGDTSVIHPTESYLSYYPQQVGLTLFFEILIRLCGFLSGKVRIYHLIKCLYVLLACVIILVQRKMAELLWESELAERIYLLLAGANLPFLMYTSFVYGEIPSFTAITLGFYFLAKLWKEGEVSVRRQLLRSGLALIFIWAGVMLRKNNLILVIALLLVMLFQWVKSRKHMLLIWGILCLAGSLLILPVTEKYYEKRAGNTISSGVTAMSYFAMGMQEASRGNGWYNGFNFNTYQSAGLDTEVANEISRAVIRERMAYFGENPDYAFRFYLGKHLSQWADGTYASRQATLATYGGRSPFFDSLYEGEGSLLYIAYCNIYQNILYLGALLFILEALKKKQDELPLYLGLICVIGGFLFHIIWEANARYIFLYSLLLVPYAAKGWKSILAKYFPLLDIK